MGVLRAWQARNCVPKPFHYFDLVLLTPLRQPKPGPPPSQPWSSRRAKRPCASAQDVHLRILRARKLKETEIWQRPQGREGHRPFAPWRVENSNSISKLLLPSTIYLVLNLAAHPGAEEGAPVCGWRCGQRRWSGRAGRRGAGGGGVRGRGDLEQVGRQGLRLGEEPDRVPRVVEASHGTTLVDGEPGGQRRAHQRVRAHGERELTVPVHPPRVVLPRPAPAHPRRDALRRPGQPGSGERRRVSGGE